MQSVVPACADVWNGRSVRCAGTPTCRIRSAVRSVSTHRSAVPSSTNEIRSTKPGDSQMAEAFIIDAVRTPRGIGKVGQGALAHMHPQHLAATVMKAIHERNGFETRDVDDVIWGPSAQKGKQGRSEERRVGKECVNR